MSRRSAPPLPGAHLEESVWDPGFHPQDPCVRWFEDRLAPLRAVDAVPLPPSFDQSTARVVRRAGHRRAESVR